MAKKTSSPLRIILLSLVLIILLGVLAFIAFTKTGLVSMEVTLPNRDGVERQLVPTPTPTPTRLKQGKETYIYAAGEGTTVPKMGTVTIDPNDPKQKDSQTVTISFDHPRPVE